MGSTHHTPYARFAYVLAQREELSTGGLYLIVVEAIKPVHTGAIMRRIAWKISHPLLHVDRL